VDCRCPTKELIKVKLQRIEDDLTDLVDVARRIVKTASDPVSAVARFLHERPENTSLPGYVIDRVLLEAFENRPEQIPSLVRILAGHVKEIKRRGNNVIDILKEHPGIEKWGSYLIKQSEVVKFEIARERDRIVFKNIGGLIAVEHGIEIPLDKILVNPPKLEVTLRLGILRPQRIIDIA
jgi:hypothetical protein